MSISKRDRKRGLKITWRQAWPIWLTFGILFGFATLWLWLLLPTAQIPTKALLQAEDVALNVRELKPNLPALFTYSLGSNQPADFFVERDARNRVTVAFASCRKCYRSGHRQHGNQILCGRCNEQMMRALDGQTPPSEPDCTQMPIPSERSGDQLTIRASSVRDTFTRWYSPVISENDNSANQSQVR